MQNVVRHNACTMDRLDNRLIAELARDSRQSNTELSHKLGVSNTTVRRRIQRLQDSGIITFATIPNPAKLGFTLTTIIGLEVEQGKTDTVAEELNTCHNIRYVSIVTGRHDIILGAWFYSVAELRQFDRDYLQKIPGLRRIETFVVLSVTKDEIGWLRGFE